MSSSTRAKRLAKGSSEWALAESLSLSASYLSYLLQISSTRERMSTTVIFVTGDEEGEGEGDNGSHENRWRVCVHGGREMRGNSQQLAGYKSHAFNLILF